MTALFLADLHLPPGDGEFNRRFVALLDGPAREADAVYLLGDVFESWIGDDVGLSLYPRETAALTALAAAGVDVAFMHGNRDFLVGRRFRRQTGVRVLGDWHRLELDGVSTAITHGDLLCTDDVRYQRWRRFCRNPIVQRLFLAMPRSRRQRVAEGMRRTSEREIAIKADTIMDVNAEATRTAFERHGVTRIIHGHTHRPDRHDHGNGRERIVLSDWRPGNCEYLNVHDGAAQRLQAPD